MPEPFQKLINQGMILGENNEKMSKSRGNVINPDSIVTEYGADSLRLYEMFMGPLEASKPWNMQGVNGVFGFLNRVWRLIMDERAETMRERGRGLRALLAEKQRGLERELTAAADEGVIETLVADADALRRELAEVDDESSALEPKLAQVEAAEQDLAAERAALAVERRDGTGASPPPRRPHRGRRAGARAEPKARPALASTPSTSRGRSRAERAPRRSPTSTESPARSPTTSSSSRDRSGGRGRPGRRAASRRARRRRRGLDAPSTSRPATRARSCSSPTHFPPVRAPVRAARRASARRVRARRPASARCSSGSRRHRARGRRMAACARHGARPPDVVAVTRDGDRLGGSGPWRLGSGTAPAVTQAAGRRRTEAAAAETRARGGASSGEAVAQLEAVRTSSTRRAGRA
jgi:hypothetical protein